MVVLAWALARGTRHIQVKMRRVDVLRADFNYRDLLATHDANTLLDQLRIEMRIKQADTLIVPNSDRVADCRPNQSLNRRTSRIPAPL